MCYCGDSELKTGAEIFPETSLVRSESRYALTKVHRDLRSTSVYTSLNPFNFIRRHFLQICVRKVAVQLHTLLEVISMSVDT
jgi:hypothetical protein